MSEYAASLKELSEPWPSGDRIKSAINRAARLAGLSYWRAFDIWYCKARRIDAHEADAIRAALNLKREERALNDLEKLRADFVRYESLLVQKFPNIDRAQLNPPRARGGALGRDYGALDRAMARK